MPPKKDEPPKPRKVYSTRVHEEVIEALRALAKADRRSMAAEFSWLVLEERGRRKGKKRERTS